MSAEIEKLLEDFASSKRAGAVALTGPWGAGKTYLWQQRVVPKVIAKPWEKRYSYVSLFGINSLSELKVALTAATGEFDHDARRQERLLASPIRWFWQAWRLVPDMLKVAPRVGAGLSTLFDRFGFYLVRDRIICFDDIERHGRQLDLRDFLGLVSYLSEQRDCRVVVILNDGQLETGDQGTWESYREKVFQGEIRYAPTPQETVELGLDEAARERWRSPLRSSLMELGISNIRLVRRSADFMRLAQDALGARTLRQETLEAMARTVAMLVFSVHGRGAGGPPLERVQRSTRLDFAGPQGRAEDVRSQEEKVWDQLISAYRIYLHTDLDEALVSMVRFGFPDSQKLRDAVDEAESNNEVRAQKEAWHQAWRLYHDTVAENGDEILAAFESTWPKVSEFERATNLQSAVEMMRLLGKPEIATQFIEEWVRQRSGDRIGELETRELHLLRRVSDSEIIECCERARNRVGRVLSPQEAFEILRDEHNYSVSAISALGKASVDDLIAIIDALVANDLSGTVKKVLDLRSNHANADWVAASEKMERACQRIAARSPLAARRMKGWFDISPEAG